MNVVIPWVWHSGRVTLMRFPIYRQLFQSCFWIAFSPRYRLRLNHWAIDLSPAGIGEVYGFLSEVYS
ncbi:MAG: hypothetical protein LUD74_05740, partial [Tannerellaceae bacterium]|nr:hypothetical protein [Tannerellaceae bacterium]